MGKNSRVIIGVVIVLVILAGFIALVHKSSPNNSHTTSSNETPKTTDNASVSNAILKTKTSSSLGSYLTTTSGKPLYIYDGDKMNVSNCTGSCLTTWPAYQDTGATTGLPTNVGTIARTDTSTEQYTYKGLPLYTFAGDSGSQPTGNGEGGFTLARP